MKANLRAIGIDVQIKNLGPGLFERISRREESLSTWRSWPGSLTSPTRSTSSVELDGRTIQGNGNGNYAYFNDPTYNRRLDAAARLSRSARLLALGRLDVRVAREEAPWAAISNERVHDFFSERIGCQLYTAVYLLDLAALCIRP